MGTRSTNRTRTLRAGVAIATGGLLLAASGLGATSAGAAPKGETAKITICHRTNSVTNPYTTNEVSVNAADGSLGNGANDHTGHLGPVFDFTADPADPGYPYHPPMNGDDWGDIIPAYEWDGGSFPGQNWDEVGQAIHASGCAAPASDEGPGDEGPGDEGPGDEGPGDEGPGDEGPGDEGPGDEGPGDEGPGDEGPGDEGPGDEGPGDEGPGDEGPGDEGPGDEGPGDDDPEPVDACPDVDGVQTDPIECEVGLIPPVVIDNDEPPAVDAAGPTPTVPTPAAAPRRPTQVAGIQVYPRAATVVAGQQLPRTGSDTHTVAVAGFGLVLLGAGAMIAARRPVEASVR